MKPRNHSPSRYIVGQPKAAARPSTPRSVKMKDFAGAALGGRPLKMRK